MASTSQQFDTLDGLVVTGDMSVGADLNVDSGTLFVDASTNRVGIGTTNPQYNLDIPGNAFIDTLTANNFNYVSITSISVDSLTLNGNKLSSTTELELESNGATAIVANSGAGTLTLEDTGTVYGQFYESSNQLVIAGSSSATPAMTLTSTGEVRFSDDIRISDGKKIDFGSVMDITASATGATFSANTYHAGKIVHNGDTDTYLDFNALDQFQITCGGSTVLSANSTIVSTKILNVEDYFKETVYAGTISANAYEIDPLLGSVHTITATNNFSVDFTNANIPQTGAITLTLVVTNSGGTHEITWPDTNEDDKIYWAEGVEPPSSNGIDIYTFYCVNGIIYGGLALRKAGWAQ